MTNNTNKEPIFTDRVIKALDHVKSLSTEELKKEAQEATVEKLRLLQFKENHKNETLH